MNKEPFSQLILFLETYRDSIRQEIVNEVSRLIHRTLTDLNSDKQMMSGKLLKESKVMELFGISRSHLRSLRKKKGFLIQKIGQLITSFFT